MSAKLLLSDEITLADSVKEQNYQNVSDSGGRLAENVASVGVTKDKLENSADPCSTLSASPNYPDHSHADFVATAKNLNADDLLHPMRALAGLGTMTSSNTQSNNDFSLDTFTRSLNERYEQLSGASDAQRLDSLTSALEKSKVETHRQMQKAHAQRDFIGTFSTLPPEPTDERGTLGDQHRQNFNVEIPTRRECIGIPRNVTTHKQSSPVKDHPRQRFSNSFSEKQMSVLKLRPNDLKNDVTQSPSGKYGQSSRRPDNEPSMEAGSSTEGSFPLRWASEKSSPTSKTSFGKHASGEKPRDRQTERRQKKNEALEAESRAAYAEWNRLKLESLTKMPGNAKPRAHAKPMPSGSDRKGSNVMPTDAEIVRGMDRRQRSSYSATSFVASSAETAGKNPYVAESAAVDDTPRSRKISRRQKSELNVSQQSSKPAGGESHAVFHQPQLNLQSAATNPIDNADALAREAALNKIALDNNFHPKLLAFIYASDGELNKFVQSNVLSRFDMLEVVKLRRIVPPSLYERERRWNEVITIGPIESFAPVSREPHANASKKMLNQYDAVPNNKTDGMQTSVKKAYGLSSESSHSHHQQREQYKSSSTPTYASQMKTGAAGRGKNVMNTGSAPSVQQNNASENYWPTLPISDKAKNPPVKQRGMPFSSKPPQSAGAGFDIKQQPGGRNKQTGWNNNNGVGKEFGGNKKPDSPGNGGKQSNRSNKQAVADKNENQKVGFPQIGGDVNRPGPKNKELHKKKKGKQPEVSFKCESGPVVSPAVKLAAAGFHFKVSDEAADAAKRRLNSGGLAS